MNLYRISQESNNDYDTYDSAIVCAKDETTAKAIHPGADKEWPSGSKYWDWCATPDQVAAKLIGAAAPGLPVGVVLASFNAG